jgi:hypothetical protein
VAQGSHTHNYAGSSSAGGAATVAKTMEGIYTGNEGRQGPSYFGKNRVGALMSNAAVNGDGHYKN